MGRRGQVLGRLDAGTGTWGRNTREVERRHREMGTRDWGSGTRGQGFTSSC